MLLSYIARLTNRSKGRITTLFFRYRSSGSPSSVVMPIVAAIFCSPCPLLMLKPRNREQLIFLSLTGSSDA